MKHGITIKPQPVGHAERSMAGDCYGGGNHVTFDSEMLDIAGSCYFGLSAGRLCFRFES